MNKIISEDFIDLVVNNESEYVKNFPEDITRLNNLYSMYHYPKNRINQCSIGEFRFYNFPKCYVTNAITSLESSGITRLQEAGNFALLGQGVLIAVIDTGIDYRHEAFLNPDKTTKIVSLWDQTINDENNHSENVLYGTVYTKDMINNALKSSQPFDLVPSQDENGHGTAIAGIMVGNESLNNNFRGVVPKAELVVVKLKPAKKILKEITAIPEDVLCYQETDIVMAINYVLSEAQKLKRPMAICIALGTSQGPHQGQGVVSNYLDFLSDLAGVAIVVSAGNEGNARRHYAGTISNQSDYNEFELKVGANESKFSMSLWHNSPGLLYIEGTSPSGERINPVYPNNLDCRRISLIFETTVLYINNIPTEGLSSDQLILVRFENPTEGVWRFRVTSLDNIKTDFNIWLPAGKIISEETFFLKSNPETTITAPGVSFYPMTITAYNHENGSIWTDSSRGYTTANVIKPELAAPGVALVCPLINNTYGTITGTGAAAAHATGVSAMFLEWGVLKGNFTKISGTEIKKILIRGAKREREQTYPNKIWGYGIIDVFEAFDSLR